MKRLKRKEQALLVGIIMIFGGLLLRSFAISTDNDIITAAAVLILSVGVGFAIAAFFSNSIISISDVKKYMMVPLSISLVILVFKKFEIQMPVLQVGLMFLINLVFFKKEIKKALKNQ
ncbi:MAG: hypothetical protein MJA31_06270 [Clostridia bacterium]|nr:hypothetical protein [Clostridia bacterium]